MRALSASELLSVWERGQAQPRVQQALLLLAAACPEISTEALAKLSIGRRDTCLLALREWTFGSQLISLAACPHCGERLELAFKVADIQVIPPAEHVEVYSLNIDDYQVCFRLPNSLDLAAVTGSTDMEAARQLLIERCLLSVEQGGEEQFAGQLPVDLVAAVGQQMGQADPQADVQLALTCPACSHTWQAVFDIISFFWSEINAWAYHILREVHILSSAYGWSEADILALSPSRRQFYLEMVGR